MLRTNVLIVTSAAWVVYHKRQNALRCYYNFD